MSAGPAGTANPVGQKPPACPICGRPADARLRPFCSKRCADVDLHRWLSESYRIPVIEDDPDALDGDKGEGSPLGGEDR